MKKEINYILDPVCCKGPQKINSVDIVHDLLASLHSYSLIGLRPDGMKEWREWDFATYNSLFYALWKKSHYYAIQLDQFPRPSLLHKQVRQYNRKTCSRTVLSNKLDNIWRDSQYS